MAKPDSTDYSAERAGRDVRSIVIFALTAVLLLAGDLLSKHFAFKHVAGESVVLTGDPEVDKENIPYHEPIVVVPKVFALQLTLNTGAVFGLGKGQRWLFLTISVVAIVVIGAIFHRSTPGKWSLHVPLAMILSGALGNMHDRFWHGAVRDMCYLFPGVKLPFGLQWPGGSDQVYPWIFNVADMALVVGVLWLLLFGGKHPKTEDKADIDPSQSAAT